MKYQTGLWSSAPVTVLDPDLIPTTCWSIRPRPPFFAFSLEVQILLAVEYHKLLDVSDIEESLVLTIDPALTSEASHPAQRDSFTKAYRYLLDVGVPSGNVIFMGGSAGGGLCILSALEAKKEGLPQPAGSILISPWMDMSLRSFQGGNALVETDYVATANTSVPMFSRMFLGQSKYKGDSPEVNPLYRTPESLRNLNPQLILVGAAEFTLQESKDWAALCRKAGVEHELVVEWGQLHVYALGSRFLDSEVRRRTDEKVVGWMSRHLSES
ncbi:hypothetical protein LTS15_002873 [Exophiala xenobiotica]|nr:hypothetical protein LTS15_002873 [Exophiala xenobiotica]